MFDLSPTHSAAAQFLERTYADELHYEDVVALLETRLAAIDSADPHAASRRTALRLQIAHVRESQLDDLEGSISALEVALDELGPDPVVAEPLAAAYRRGEYHADLVELCRSAADASGDPAERANWWARLGDAQLCLDQPAEAADAYRHALTERPGDRAIAASLRELYRALGRPEPLVALLETELRHLAGRAEIPVRLELVELQRAAQPASALVHATRVLQLVPRHRTALDAALELAGVLGRHDDALALLEGRIRSAQTAHEAAPWRARAARLLAGPLARRADAIAAYRAALDGDPGQRDARELRGEWVVLLEREQRWEEWLAGESARLVDLAASERDAHVERIARLAWERISPAAALPWLERMRSAQPENPEWLAQIARAHRELGQREALLRALADQAAVASGADRARCHVERATLLRDAGETGRALAALTEAGPQPDAHRRSKHSPRAGPTSSCTARSPRSTPASCARPKRRSGIGRLRARSSRPAARRRSRSSPRSPPRSARAVTPARGRATPNASSSHCRTFRCSRIAAASCGASSRSPTTPSSAGQTPRSPICARCSTRPTSRCSAATCSIASRSCACGSCAGSTTSSNSSAGSRTGSSARAATPRSGSTSR